MSKRIKYTNKPMKARVTQSLLPSPQELLAKGANKKENRRDIGKEILQAIRDVKYGRSKILSKNDIKTTLYNPSHPGEILREFIIEPLGLTVSEVAHHLNISRKTLSKILNTSSPIKPEMAVRLEKGFGNPPAEHWLRLQSAYDLWHIRQYVSELKVKPIWGRREIE